MRTLYKLVGAILTLTIVFAPFGIVIMELADVIGLLEKRK